MELVRAAHIALGELAILAFIWVILEVVVGPNGVGVLRARAAALLGSILMFGAWLLGGLYYVVHYGEQVKPVIKEGPWPWAHGIFMESKEHLFLFLPFLGITATALLWQHASRLREDRTMRFAVYTLTGVIVLIGILMSVMGYFISSGFREALIPGA